MIKNAIRIQGTGKSFCVFFETQEEKVKWLTSLNTAISDEIKRQATLKTQLPGEMQEEAAPIWTPDDEVNICPLCRVPFSIFRRKHHCRMCGTIICSDCSQNTALVQYYDKKSRERACDKCYHKLQD
eukprot:TRINITY_DN8173_c0_g2_i2.p1 TRINITY_DN8173_c0_g2~~TRINITY_DN8173_c0_g2_i2.p1  ORF type:complete len:127 (-),score=20.91 TRINITY_DN8173_c0_g2_i2:58-438(-)